MTREVHGSAIMRGISGLNFGLKPYILTEPHNMAALIRSMHSDHSVSNLAASSTCILLEYQSSEKCKQDRKILIQERICIDYFKVVNKKVSFDHSRCFITEEFILKEDCADADCS